MFFLPLNNLAPYFVASFVFEGMAVAFIFSISASEILANRFSAILFAKAIVTAQSSLSSNYCLGGFCISCTFLHSSGKSYYQNCSSFDMSYVDSCLFYAYYIVRFYVFKYIICYRMLGVLKWLTSFAVFLFSYVGSRVRFSIRTSQPDSCRYRSRGLFSPSSFLFR